jgi:hypothetical protein
MEVTISETGTFSALSTGPEISSATSLDISHLVSDDRDRPSTGTSFSSVAFAIGAGKHISAKLQDTH